MLFSLLRKRPAYEKALLTIGALGVGYDWRELVSISHSVTYPHFDLVYFGLTLKPYTPVLSAAILLYLGKAMITRRWIAILAILLLAANIADYASSIHLVGAFTARLAALPATTWYMTLPGSSTLKYK